MIDVKIGLAARFFGQFGEGYKNAAIPEVLQDKFCPRQFGRRRQIKGALFGNALVYSELSWANPRYGVCRLWSRQKDLLLTWLFFVQKKGTFENDIVCKRMLV